MFIKIFAKVLRVVLPITLGLVLVAPAWGANKKAVVHLEKQARGPGQIVLAFLPEGGEETTVTITAIKGAKTKELARDIMKELKFALDKELYKVQMKDERKVAVEAKSKAPSFELQVREQSVPGLSIFVRY